MRGLTNSSKCDTFIHIPRRTDSGNDNKRGYIMARSKNTFTRPRSFTNKERAQMTNKIRTYLRSLSNRRSNGYVSADDVHTYLTRENVLPGQVRTRLSFINSVLREPDFEPVDTVPSSRPAAKGRMITAWTA